MVAPKLELVRTACPECGATNEEEASNFCRPTTDETGEVSCGTEFDAEGFSVWPSAESLAAMDAWIDTQDKD